MLENDAYWKPRGVKLEFMEFIGTFWADSGKNRFWNKEFNFYKDFKN